MTCGQHRIFFGWHTAVLTHYFFAAWKTQEENTLVNVIIHAFGLLIGCTMHFKACEGIRHFQQKEGGDTLRADVDKHRSYREDFPLICEIMQCSLNFIVRWWVLACQLLLVCPGRTVHCNGMSASHESIDGTHVHEILHNSVVWEWYKFGTKKGTPSRR